MRHLLFVITVVICMPLIACTVIIVHSCIYGADGFRIARLAYRTGGDVFGSSGPYDPPWLLEDDGFYLYCVHARVKIGWSRNFAADNGDPHPYRHSSYSFEGSWANQAAPSFPWFYYSRGGGPPFSDPREGFEGSVITILPAPLGVFPMVILSVLFIFIYRQMRRNKGLCQKCGYDIRATPNRCPECGTIPRLSNGNCIGEQA
jgi:hypothetical protein